MKRVFTTIGLAFALVVVLAPPAGASGLNLDRVRGMDLVGERVDGYLGIVVPQTVSAVEALVKRINARRRAAYEQVAQKNGTTVGVAEVIAGERLIARAPKGAWVTDADGVWRQK